MKKNYVWTTNRIVDTLSKYPNHKIISILQMGNKLCFEIEYLSEKFNSKVITNIRIYADGEYEQC